MKYMLIRIWFLSPLQRIPHSVYPKQDISHLLSCQFKNKNLPVLLFNFFNATAEFYMANFLKGVTIHYINSSSTSIFRWSTYSNHKYGPLEKIHNT